MASGWPIALALPLALVYLGVGCQAATRPTPSAPRPAEATPETPKAAANFTSVIAVIPVGDHAAATAWYESWIGRGADVVPSPGVAEWKLAEGGWVQVSQDPEHAGSATVVVGVANAEAQRAACEAAGADVGEVQDLGFVKLVETVDPDGNKIVFAQETSAP